MSARLVSPHQPITKARPGLGHSLFGNAASPDQEAGHD
ncbi:hypothetical protein FHT97_001505 [Rhizobium sp. BK399]|nr:hypothetical protein [Rhizobium sp. BK399]